MSVITKPFQLKDLIVKLKAGGLDIAEDAAKLIVDSTFDWAAEGAAIHPNALVKAAVPLVIQVVKPAIESSVDKIDGHVG